MHAPAARITLRPMTAPAVWSGRVLAVVIGGFLALDAGSRLVWGQPLVAASAASADLPATAQSLLGAALLLGAGLLALTRTRLAGALLLTACLIVPLVAEARTDAPSADHLLFWAYVTALLWAGTLLRRLSTHRT